MSYLKRAARALVVALLLGLLGACSDDGPGAQDSRANPDVNQREGGTDGTPPDGTAPDGPIADSAPPDAPRDLGRDLVERFDGADATPADGRADAPDAGVDTAASDAGADTGVVDGARDTIVVDGAGDTIVVDSGVDSFPNDAGAVTRRLVGFSGANTVSIVASSGATAVIGAHGLSSIGPVTYDPALKQIYTLVDQSTTSPKLARIDPCSGVGSIIGAIAVSGRTISQAEALAYNPSTNVLYATVSLNGADSRSESLLVLDKASGVAQSITAITGTIQDDGDGMLFVGNNAYMTDDPGSGPTSLYTFNVTSGQATLVGTFSTPRINNIAQMAHDFIANVVYADGGSNQAGRLLTVDLSTATATVGPVIQATPNVRRFVVVDVTCPAPSGG